jgi:hypothetical protein
MTGVGQLDANRVRALFQDLSDRLAAGGVQAQLFVVGGAAMALAYHDCGAKGRPRARQPHIGL